MPENPFKKDSEDMLEANQATEKEKEEKRKEAERDRLAAIKANARRLKTEKWKKENPNWEEDSQD